MNNETTTNTRFNVAVLTRFATALLSAAGMDADKASTMSRLLVLTDTMGRRTHGLAMLPLYLADIRKGEMKETGEPVVVKDTGATLVWDGDYLPGQWLVHRAGAKNIAHIVHHRGGKM